MLVIGLTGGIGAGKSEAGKVLGSLGAHIINTDLVSRQVVMPGKPALLDIARVFGEEYLEKGELNRAKLADLVFRDADALKKLNEIVHPRVIEETAKEVAQVSGRTVVIEAPLLVEAGMLSMVDQIWVVISEYELRIERIMIRGSLTREEAESRIASQLAQEDYLAYADVIIDNSGTLADLEEQVKAKWGELVKP